MVRVISLYAQVMRQDSTAQHKHLGSRGHAVRRVVQPRSGAGLMREPLLAEHQHTQKPLACVCASILHDETQKYSTGTCANMACRNIGKHSTNPMQRHSLGDSEHRGVQPQSHATPVCMDKGNEHSHAPRKHSHFRGRQQSASTAGRQQQLHDDSLPARFT